MKYIGNYNHYRKFQDTLGLSSMFWDKSPPSEELLALEEYNSINENELIAEIENLIKKSKTKQLGKRRYDLRLKAINNKGFNTRDIQSQINSFLINSINNYMKSENEFMRDLLICKTLEERKKLILSELESIKYHIHKLLFITDFESKLIKVLTLMEIKEDYYDSQNKSKNNLQKLTVPRLVLFYHYVHASGEKEMFEVEFKTKEEGILNVLKNYPEFNSYKNFQSHYNKVSFKSNRVATNQIKNIRFVISNLMKDFPKAKKIATSELKEALNKPKSK